MTFKRKTRDALLGYAFLSPALILIYIFAIIPILLSVFYAFTDYYLLWPDDVHWIGFDNFRYMIERGDEVKQVIWNTIRFALMVIPLQLGLAMGLALLINKPRKMTLLYRLAFFSPVVLSLVVVSILGLQLVAPDGLLNNMIMQFGGQPIDFLGKPGTAMLTIVVLSAWQGAGFQMLILLAGLQNINNALYEAAEIDGANKFKQFIHVTLPGLKPTMTFVLIITTIGALKLMIQPMVMTGGGPLNSTKTIVLYIYQEGFVKRDVGYASAVALVFTVFVGAITLIQRRLMREED